MGAEFVFMDDNACPPLANIVGECLQRENITRMDWPAFSPDLNPIKHVCFKIFNKLDLPDWLVDLSIENASTYRNHSPPATPLPLVRHCLNQPLAMFYN
ncbi:DDE_3 domain-containing protein [Trichonephila clavipes]|nr:DDE_3 domain-containing protein [Trichonephila clavipes]